jgi:phosphate transport system substrate-binding protein
MNFSPTSFLLSAVLLLAGAGPGLSSELPVVGTGDGIDILRAISVSFNKGAAESEITVPPSIGSGGGVAAVGSGNAVLGRIARELTEAEVARGIVAVPIARLPSAVFVNPGAGVASISAVQLRDIYAGLINNWKDVGGADLRIRVVRREEADSTLSVLRASMPGWRDLEITDKSKMATSTQEAVETVRSVNGAVGFGPFTKTLEEGTTVLRIDGRYPVDPSYPSAVTLSLIHLRQTKSAEADAFIDYAKGSDAQKLISAFGAVPIP